MKHHVIGIDLGTTYSAVAAYDHDEDEAVIFGNPWAGDDASTPSVVGLQPGNRKVIVGHEAKRQLAADPLNTIIEIKREMGEEFDPKTHAGRDGFEAGKPVRVRFAEFPEQWYLPQEVSAFILMRMKEIAEADVGEEIRDAVVTVPAYFHATQKRATEQAALLAGLYPRQLIPEPTAAAICYGVDRYEVDRKTYLVYDLGGGTFDVSIIQVQEEKIDVVATAGDPRLGGSDFDDVITEWAVAELQRLHQLDVSGDPRARAAIKYQAEQAKIRLSTFEEAELPLADLHPQAAPVLKLTRQRFEELIDDLLSRSMSAVETALGYAAEKGVRREDVSGVLLVGGSSNVPRVRALLQDHFQRGDDFVRGDLDPATVVARGAATLARRFVPTEHAFDLRNRPDSTLVDGSLDDDLKIGLITEHSLGVGVQDNRVVHLVDRGTGIPTSVTKTDFANPGPVEFLKAPVYQGESEYTYENTLIGEVELGPMTPLPPNSHQFHVTFALDVNGLLAVTVHHVNEDRTYEAKFERDTSVESDEALAAMRGKLLDRFQPMPMNAPPVAHPPAPSAAQTYVPPPPAPASAPAVEAPPAAEASPAEASPAAGPPEPSREVPDQFKSIVRRARKRLLKEPAPELLEAYAAFVAALDEGRPEDDLLDLGDDLADAYMDVRAVAH